MTLTAQDTLIAELRIENVRLRIMNAELRREVKLLRAMQELADALAAKRAGIVAANPSRAAN